MKDKELRIVYLTRTCDDEQLLVGVFDSDKEVGKAMLHIQEVLGKEELEYEIIETPLNKNWIVEEDKEGD